jgi:nanoRNase/pAp phosphatase (c-di-AMP/oligoRNAs hydrolase)
MTNELYECSGARALTPEKDHLDVIDPSHPRNSLEGRPPSMESFEDRDLFRFQFSDTDACSDYLHTVDLNNVPSMAKNLSDPDRYLQEEVLLKGQILNNRKLNTVKKLSKSFIRLDGKIAVFNHAEYISDLAKYVLSNNSDLDLVVCWFLSKETMVFSVRSRANSNITALDLCSKFGGGGHVSAGGFNMPLLEGLAFLERAYKQSSILTL